MNECSICGARTGLVYRGNGWCCPPPFIDCNARARERLGIPAGIVRRLRAKEWTTYIAARERVA